MTTMSVPSGQSDAGIDYASTLEKLATVPEYSLPATPIDSEKPSFFSLPLNIRQTIYRHAVVVKKLFVRPFLTGVYVRDPYRLEKYGSPNMAIFQTCKRVYEECSMVFYQENIFSIVHVDFLVGLMTQYPRVREAMKYIHKIEVVFDGRDYRYLTEVVTNDLDEAVTFLKEQYNGELSANAKVASESMIKLRDAFLGTAHRPKNGEPMTRQHLKNLHVNAILQLYEHLWGRTLTFIRHHLLVTDLYLNFFNCCCPAGCCRLTTFVMDWGWSRIWVFGAPINVHICGTTKREREKILDSIARQTPYIACIDQLVDISKLIHHTTFTNRATRETLKELGAAC